MVCNTCGYWNDEEEVRCTRCGRRLHRQPETSWQRTGLELDESQLQAGKEAAAGTSARVQKNEISRKVEEYRERQRARSALRRDSEEPDREAAASNVIPFENAANLRAGGSGSLPAPAEQRLPSLDSTDRFEEKAPLDDQKTRLPPLGGDRSTADAAPIAASRRPAAKRKPSTEVRCSSTVAAIQIRLFAGLLDLAMVLVALGAFLGVFHWFGGSLRPGEEGIRTLVITCFVILAFYWAFYVGHFGATPGMNWTGLRMLDFYGRLPSGKQRAARSLGLILSSATLGLGFVWSLLDEEKLTWHDRMSKTFLTRDRAAGFRSRAERIPIRAPHLPDTPQAGKKL